MIFSKSRLTWMFFLIIFSISLHANFRFNLTRCSRIYLHVWRNLSGAKNILQIRVAAAEIDCSPEPQVAKWAGVATRQQHSWSSATPPSLATRAATVRSVSAKLCEILAVHCLTDARACAPRRAGMCVWDASGARVWNVDCSSVHSNKLQRKLLKSSSKSAPRTVYRLSVRIPCKRRAWIG